MARLYLDEDLADLARGLREGGHDVVSVVEEERRISRSDAWHFQQAIADSRIILTWNRDDFQVLHQLWTRLQLFGVLSDSHPGILTAAAKAGYRRANWIPVVIQKLTAAEGLRGRLWIWISSDARWQEDKVRPETGD